MSTSKEYRAAAAKRADAKQDPTELRAALAAERNGYVARGLPDRAKQVEAQLKAIGKAAPAKDSDEKPGTTPMSPRGRRPIGAGQADGQQADGQQADGAGAERGAGAEG